MYILYFATDVQLNWTVAAYYRIESAYFRIRAETGLTLTISFHTFLHNIAVAVFANAQLNDLR